MTITINGKRQPVRSAANVAELVRELSLVPETLLVEHNGRALHRSQWKLSALNSGDVVELVRVVAGG